MDDKSALFKELCSVSKSLQSLMNYMFFETKDASPELRATFQKHGTHIHDLMMDTARTNVLIGWNLIDDMLGKSKSLPPKSSMENSTLSDFPTPKKDRPHLTVIK